MTPEYRNQEKGWKRESIATEPVGEREDDGSCGAGLGQVVVWGCRDGGQGGAQARPHLRAG